MTEPPLPPRIAGRLCLEFTNTAEARRDAQRGEYLGSYARLLAWAGVLGVLTEAEVDVLARLAADEPAAAEATYRRAVDVRETLYRAFAALAGGRSVADDDRAGIEQAAVDALAHGRLGAAGNALAWTWPAPQSVDDLARPLWPVVHSAVELLTSPSLSRVKECPGAGDGPCSWLFVDLSKNGSRRWCRMAECGSVAKARRQTSRRRAVRDRE